MKRRFYLIYLIAFLFPYFSDAQVWKMRRYEAMGGIVTSNYFGDIGGYSKGDNALGLKDFKLFQTRPGFYLGARYKVLENLSAKLNFTLAFLHGTDEGGVNEGRNFKFSTTVFEPSVQVEYSFLPEKGSRSYLMMKGKGIGTFQPSFSAYVFAGLGGAFFGTKKLENLEDVDFEYSKTTLVLPIGVGVKIGLTPKFSAGFDLGGRFTTTDYLDAYSSKYSKSNDVYYFGVFSLIYKLKTSRTGWPVFR
ncbi:MAG: hypothetical protein KAX05_02635 [Bacteroidales bacterium]|nr:hypothetical protein [Bacteroidales bacterium]